MSIVVVNAEKYNQLFINQQPKAESLMNTFTSWKNLGQNESNFQYILYWNPDDIELSGILFRDFEVIDGTEVQLLIDELIGYEHTYNKPNKNELSEFEQICFDSYIFIRIQSKLKDTQENYEKLMELMNVFHMFVTDNQQ